MSKSELLALHASERSKCITYTRVMGYLRPTESFNMGKAGEHAERVQFNESCCGR